MQKTPNLQTEGLQERIPRRKIIKRGGALVGLSTVVALAFAGVKVPEAKALVLSGNPDFLELTPYAGTPTRRTGSDILLWSNANDNNEPYYEDASGNPWLMRTRQQASYIVELVGSTYYARSAPNSGLALYSGPEIGKVVSNAASALTNGGLIFVRNLGIVQPRRGIWLQSHVDLVSEWIELQKLAENKQALTANANSGQNIINVASASGFLVGDELMVTYPGNPNEPDDVLITNISGNQLTLDMNLHNSYTTAESAYVINDFSLIRAGHAYRWLSSYNNVSGFVLDGNGANRSTVVIPQFDALINFEGGYGGASAYGMHVTNCILQNGQSASAALADGFSFQQVIQGSVVDSTAIALNYGVHFGTYSDHVFAERCWTNNCVRAYYLCFNDTYCGFRDCYGYGEYGPAFYIDTNDTYSIIENCTAKSNNTCCIYLGNSGSGYARITKNTCIGNGSIPGIVSTSSSGHNLIKENQFLTCSPLISPLATDFVLNNPGYNPQSPSTPALPGSSVAFPLLPYDANYVVTSTTGLTGLTLDGTAVDYATGTIIYVPAHHALTPSYTGTPTFEILPI